MCRDKEKQQRKWKMNHREKCWVNATTTNARHAKWQMVVLFVIARCDILQYVGIWICHQPPVRFHAMLEHYASHHVHVYPLYGRRSASSNNCSKQ